ncbi:MAG: flagellar biosynthesis anti-sigma factor FlgM [Betaproteobacteria bacterium]
MTDAISQYGRPNPSDNAVRSNSDKVSKKASSAPSVLSTSTEGGDKAAPVRQGGDTVSLSNVAQKAMAEPEFDRAKVESIKKAISQGQYPLDPKRIAESFLAVERMIRD